MRHARICTGSSRTHMYRLTAGRALSLDKLDLRQPSEVRRMHTWCTDLPCILGASGHGGTDKTLV